MGKTTSLMRFWEFLRILPNTFWNSWKNGLNTGSLWLPTQMSALALRAYPCWFEPMKMVCCLRSVSSHLLTQSGSAFARLTIILLFFFCSSFLIQHFDYVPVFAKDLPFLHLGLFFFFQFQYNTFLPFKGTLCSCGPMIQIFSVPPSHVSYIFLGIFIEFSFIADLTFKTATFFLSFILWFLASLVWNGLLIWKKKRRIHIVKNLFILLLKTKTLKKHTTINSLFLLLFQCNTSLCFNALDHKASSLAFVHFFYMFFYFSDTLFFFFFLPFWFLHRSWFLIFS